MAEPLNPATRPSRISTPGQILITTLLVLSFVSGVLVWRGLAIQAERLSPPAWLHPALVLHGSLNPLLCILFGWLVCHHIRAGSELRANLVSGLAMVAVFAGLILTGAGLYYAGSIEWRERMIWGHRVLGLLWPVAMAGHWVAGLRWAKKVQQ